MNTEGKGSSSEHMVDEIKQRPDNALHCFLLIGRLSHERANDVVY
jgi:hypothetical protein